MNSLVTSLVPGIADSKKADIDSLTDQVENAQYDVEQLQAVVTSLTEKSNQFSGFLAEADANKTISLNNLNLAKDSLANLKNLVASATRAQTQTNTTVTSVSSVSAQLSVLINKLIFSVEVIDKLAQLINKQKAINPIIPDDLIKFLTKATTDANTAVATSLTALTSAYAAEATALESQSITNLELSQIQTLYNKMIVGLDPSPLALIVKSGFVFGLTDNSTGIVALLKQGYTDSVNDYERALNANNMVTQQLEFAQANLDSAIVRLNSLKSGLAAATAAAYAA